MTDAKLTNGLNDRAKNATIAQTGAGLPDDTGKPLEIDEKEAAQIEDKIRNMGSSTKHDAGQPDQASPTNQDGGDASGQLQSDIQEDIDLPMKGSA